MHMNIDFPLK